MRLQSVNLLAKLLTIFSPLFAPWRNRSPAAVLIRQSARRQWRLLGVTFATGLLGSLSEGATLAVIFLAVGLMTSSSTASLAEWPALLGWPWLRQLLEGLSQWQPELVFLLLLALAVALQLLMSLCNYINTVASEYFGARLFREITDLINRRILSFTYACASNYRVGDLLDYAAAGGATVQTQINLINSLVVTLLQMLVYLAILISISPWLLLVGGILAGCLWLVQRELLPRIRENALHGQIVSVELGSRITENIQGLRWLHSSGGLQATAAGFANLLVEIERIRRRNARLTSVVNPFSAFLPILAIAIIAGVSVVMFANRVSGVLPSLVTFVLALQRLNVRLGIVAGLASRYASNSAGLQRLNQILARDGKQFVRSGGIPFVRLQQGVHLQEVSLRYAPNLPMALEGINLEIPVGSTVALVGASGAGKSSIADLLVGLYDPTEGRILIDGVDLQQIELASWQQRLGVVSQDTFLFNASIGENIAYGVANASPAEIRAAAQTAQADGFIEALPQGYNTLVGERGYRLSGGQRQRLSLARAILRKPELLILDEATSALDTESERLVQDALDRIRSAHTRIVIAHRLSTIINADQIVVIKHGRVVECGNHYQLLGQAGEYSKALAQQAKEPLENPIE